MIYKEPEIYVFYHRMDLDGWCSMAIAMRHFEKLNKKITPIGYHYGDPIDFDSFVEGSRFVFLDVFPQPYEEMHDKFREKSAGPLFVIDHHKTFIESSVSRKTEGVAITSHAACELAWDYFSPYWIWKAPPLLPPLSIQALGQYDSWRQKNDYLPWDSVVLPFQYAARLILKDPTEHWGAWEVVLSKEPAADEWFYRQVELGKSLLAHETRRSAKVLSNNFLEADFEGLHVIACNDGSYNSLLFDSKWDESKYDAMLAYSIRSNGLVSASLYATDPAIDCSPVAQKLGGGGHAHACGFTLPIDQFFGKLGLL